jgi:phosphotransferase system  glucose/maltose/N-acetylglucosamine-specific IIC component
MIAAALLAVISFNGLFAGTSVGFVASALLVVTYGFAVQRATGPQQASVFERTTRGMRIYLATSRLVGLLTLLVWPAVQFGAQLGLGSGLIKANR